jgi:hypothetical protein
MRQDQDAARQAQAAAGRRLLQQLENEGELAEPLSRSSRALLSSSSSSSSSLAPLFVLKPLQLHTYVFGLRGSEWAESQSGIMVGVGQRADGTSAPVAQQPTVTRPKPMPATSKPAVVTPVAPPSGVVAPPVSVVGAAAGRSASDGADSGNVLQGHEHTVLPGHARESWRLIPTRVEYFVVLVASLLGVAFFLQALRIIARAGDGATRPGRVKQATH